MEFFILYPDRLKVELSDRIFKRKLYLYLRHVKGMNVNQISTFTEDSISTIYEVLKKWRFHGKIEDIERTGRPTKLLPETKLQIVKMQKDNRTERITDIYRKIIQEQSIENNIKYKNVWKVINENFKTKFLNYKITISDKNLKKRVTWCEEHIKWRNERWKNVIFTDEKLFVLYPQGKKIRVKLTFDENLNDYSAKKMHSSGGGLLFWGAISLQGKIHLTVLYNNVNSEDFAYFLKNEAIPNIMKKHGPRFILMQDNAPPHRGATTKFLIKELINVMEWPPQSPDLNPIELVWMWMQNKIYDRIFTTPKELEQFVFSLWDEIPNEVIFAFIHKIPDKILWILENEGKTYRDK